MSYIMIATSSWPASLLPLPTFSTLQSQPSWESANVIPAVCLVQMPSSASLDLVMSTLGLIPAPAQVLPPAAACLLHTLGISCLSFWLHASHLLCHHMLPGLVHKLLTSFPGIGHSLYQFTLHEAVLGTPVLLFHICLLPWRISGALPFLLVGTKSVFSLSDSLHCLTEAASSLRSYLGVQQCRFCLLGFPKRKVRLLSGATGSSTILPCQQSPCYKYLKYYSFCVHSSVPTLDFHDPPSSLESTASGWHSQVTHPSRSNLSGTAFKSSPPEPEEQSFLGFSKLIIHCPLSCAFLFHLSSGPGYIRLPQL